MTMKELTCSENKNLSLTGSVGKKPQLTCSDNIYSRLTGSISKKPTNGFTVIVNT